MTTIDLQVQGDEVKRAARELAQSSNETRQAVLHDVADRLLKNETELLGVNEADLEDYRESGPGRDRLALTNDRVTSMASALRTIARGPDPLFEAQDQQILDNGLHVERLRVPLGVIGVGYENRPNV